VGEADIALCERLIDAFARAEAESPAPPGLWTDDLFQDRQRQLRDALERREPTLLAERLASMFRSDFVLGLAPGSLGVGQTGFAAKLARLDALNKLVALAESQGVARLENPEQGRVGLAFAEGIDALVARTEAALGLSLDFPDVGAAYGIRAAGHLITGDTPDQIYAAARLREAMRSFLPDSQFRLRVVEIGGGYGGMAYWLLQMIDPQYTIIDLPIVNVLQGYFLSQALDTAEVSLYGEAPRRIAITPTHALSSVPAPIDVLANKDSMPEIPTQTALHYLSWAQANCRGILYSYNQEAAAIAEGMPQNVVPELIERFGGFLRLRRDASWLRRGYAEEVYQNAP
jgi:hypothetical protein